MTKLEFPIQIGLVGAPGSGKLWLADAFVNLSAEWFEENKSEFRVIANAGKVIEERDGQAVGVFGSWMEDLRAYYVRYEAEQEARRDGASFLSLGTALEQIAHCGVNAENILVGLATPDQQQRLQRQQVVMTALTFLFQQQFQYVFGFYLPHPGASVILPGQEDDTENTYNQRIDNALRTIFGNFGLRIQVLDQPTYEEKAQAMFDTVRDIVENGVPERPESEDPGEELHHLLEEEKLAEKGIELHDWTPDVPPVDEPTLAE